MYKKTDIRHLIDWAVENIDQVKNTASIYKNDLLNNQANKELKKILIEDNKNKKSNSKAIELKAKRQTATSYCALMALIALLQKHKHKYNPAKISKYELEVETRKQLQYIEKDEKFTNVWKSIKPNKLVFSLIAATLLVLLFAFFPQFFIFHDPHELVLSGFDSYEPYILFCFGFAFMYFCYDKGGLGNSFYIILYLKENMINFTASKEKI